MDGPQAFKSTMTNRAGSVGRPARVGKFTLLPVQKPEGWEHNDPKAEAIKAVHQNYLKAGELPPYLRPTRSSALTKRKNDNISRGFKDPKGGRTV